LSVWIILILFKQIRYSVCLNNFLLANVIVD